MNSYKASPISRAEIRRMIRLLKCAVGLENVCYFPVIHFLENILPMLFPDFQLEIVPESEMGNKHGETYPSRHLIRIREDVYLRAVNGEGRDRLTVAHEIGHLLLHENDAIALCRLAPNEKLKPYEDPEWQANAFGGELLAPSYLIRGMNPYQVKETFGVSLDAAVTQLKSLK